MKFVNFDMKILDEPEFSEASPHQIGIWLRLFAYCARQENGGGILTAGSWSEAHCRRIVGCSRAELGEHSPLWHLRPGGMLSVYHYNLAAEEWSKKMRRTASAGGQRGGLSQSPPKRQAARENGQKGGRPQKVIAFRVSSNSNNPNVI